MNSTIIIAHLQLALARPLVEGLAMEKIKANKEGRMDKNSNNVRHIRRDNEKKNTINSNHIGTEPRKPLQKIQNFQKRLKIQKE